MHRALSCLAAALLFAAPPFSSSAADRVVFVQITAYSEAPGYEAQNAMDGEPDSIWHTAFGSRNPRPPHFLEIDLGREFEVHGFAALPRKESRNGVVKEAAVFVGQTWKAFGEAIWTGTLESSNAWREIKFEHPVQARFIRIEAKSEVNGQAWASFAEIKIISPGIQFRSDSPWILSLNGKGTKPETELEWQYAALLRDLRQRDRFVAISNETLRAEALIWPSDRDPADVVARRTSALFADLKPKLEPATAKRWERELAALRKQAAECPAANSEARFQLFEELCLLRRQIAFANPLLNFDQLLFLKRHRSLFNHMCDQYYGITARPGGGLFVLSNPFGKSPQVKDVLENAVVASGRLKGERLASRPNKAYKLHFDGEGNLSGDATEGGSFLSPEISYDGNSILFAYVECTGGRGHDHHTDPTRGHWAEGRSYHIFQVNRDGSELRQLTDGTWNDFSPCWLPNGRVAFISERRGGYLRCGRVCPTYTLFDMAADGSDMNCLSFHETNEWDPSVTHDGRIIWTRWDYVDRHGCTAHAPWITSLDGRNPRPVHGNYAPRKTRPDMELNVRAIPASPKYIATAAPHHGQAFGSMVLVDPRVQDDDGMAPVKRLTPDVDFPESQLGAEAYGTGWPLSEDYFLCAYDVGMPPGNHEGKHLTQYPNKYGLYLVDSFGNRELIYRDPDISCVSPMPLRARPHPPSAAIAATAEHSSPASPKAVAEGTVSVINVYDSLLPWPAKTKIAALRVLQVLPMSVPSGAPPHETGLRVATAGDSVVPVRHVLGTAKVEEDGSAHFIAPANRELFFQALDETGAAVQSMRSATALRPGEQMVCHGCHAPSGRTPPTPDMLPIAVRRPPERLKPDVDGSNPFSYPRLVQPVLDRQCVSCHAENSGKAPNLAREPFQKNWFASYNSLAAKFGFHDYGGSYRTIPGQFGARASKLLPLLEKGHYNVRLTPEELHRLTLWLDCSSMFYGVYEKEGGLAQLRGEVVRPTLE